MKKIIVFLTLLATLPIGYLFLTNSFGKKHISIQDMRKAKQCIQEALKLLESNKRDEAMQKLEYALSLNHYDPEIYLYFGQLKQQQNKPAEALKLFNTGLKMKPNYFEIEFCKGTLLKDMGKLDKAKALLEKLYAQSPDYPHLNHFLKQVSLAEGKIKIKELLKNNQSLRGKKLLIFGADWGFGDAFQLMRFVKFVKGLGAHVTLEVQLEPLMPLFSLVTYIDKLVPSISIASHKQLIESADFYIAMTDMPEIFKDMLNQVIWDKPYLDAHPALVKEWQQVLNQDNNYKIGLCWSGNRVYNAQDNRAISLQKLAMLSEFEGISLYSLQKDKEIQQIQGLDHPNAIKTFDDNFDIVHGRFMDTAAIMKNLDLVITIDTSLAHLAGALGVPVWILLPEPSEHRWGENPKLTGWAPNYATMKLFKQKNSGDWDAVIKEVIQELKTVVQKVR